MLFVALAAPFGCGPTSSAVGGASDATFTVLSADGTLPSADPAPDAFASNCAACHGASAEGSDLAPEIRHPSPAYASWVIRNGRDGSAMAAFSSGALSDAALTQILDWLASFPHATTGEQLYLDFCANCHGSDGGGGVVGEAVTGKPFSELQQRVRSGTGTNYASRRTYMPAFGSAELSDAELSLIGGFLGAR